jgi:hypothetical protein
MSFPEIMNLVSGLLQFSVAGYALRLNRIFGTARVGWSLFCAFTLLALLHFVQSALRFNQGSPWGAEVEVIYFLISLLLLIGLAHIETLLKERLRVEQEEKRLRGGLELQVKEKTAHLTRTVEELQSEIAERKRVQAEFEKAQKELLAASRQAGKTEIAERVLRNVGDMLKSVNTSAALVSDQMQESRISHVVQFGSLIREHAADLGDFVTRDPQGQTLLTHIAQLAEHLVEEQAVLKSELEFLRKNIEHIKIIVTMEQSCARLGGEVDVSRATTFVGAAILKNARTPGPWKGHPDREHEPPPSNPSANPD